MTLKIATVERLLDDLKYSLHRGDYDINEAVILARILGIIGTELQVDFDPPLPGDFTEAASAFLKLVAMLERLRHQHSNESQPETIELSASEIEEIEEIIGALRRAIRVSKALPESHKGRLLKRAARLQLEIHKAQSNYEAVLAALGEAGEAVGKFGNDVKPVFDRFKEIAKVFDRKSDDPIGIEQAELARLPAPEEQEEGSSGEHS
ncbi:MAG: hypothetical protein AAFP17_02905 [Pseudomonadota bacterium]